MFKMNHAWLQALMASLAHLLFLRVFFVPYFYFSLSFNFAVVPAQTCSQILIWIICPCARLIDQITVNTQDCRHIKDKFCHAFRVSLFNFMLLYAWAVCTFQKGKSNLFSCWTESLSITLQSWTVSQYAG